MFTLTWKCLQTNKNYKVLQTTAWKEKTGAPEPPLCLVSGIATADHKEQGLGGNSPLQTEYLAGRSKFNRAI